MIQRRAQNKIHGLEDASGEWKELDDEVQGIIVQYFSNIFSTSNPSGFTEVLSGVGRSVTQAMNNILTTDVTVEEIKLVVFQMEASKAPGPNGFTTSFFPESLDNSGKGYYGCNS